MVFKSYWKARWLLVIILGFFSLGMAASPPLVGGPAPAFKLETVDGKILQLSDLKGRLVILNFWATWCVPCIKEMPEFEKVHQSLNPAVQIIGINMAESKEKVGEYIKAHDLSFPILLDDFGNVSQEYEVLHLPVTYFITADGVIRDKIFGGGITGKMIEDKINQLN